MAKNSFQTGPKKHNSHRRMLCPDIPSSRTSFIRGTLGAAMPAHLAHFDDDWHDFKEFEPVSVQGTRMDRVNLVVEQVTGVLRVLPELNNSFSWRNKQLQVHGRSGERFRREIDSVSDISTPKRRTCKHYHRGYNIEERRVSMRSDSWPKLVCNNTVPPLQHAITCQCRALHSSVQLIHAVTSIDG